MFPLLQERLTVRGLSKSVLPVVFDLLFVFQGHMAFLDVECGGAERL